MLRIENLEAYYNGLRVLKGISTGFERGEFACILGPNGAGKTTMLRAIANLINFDGSIEINGKDIKHMSRKAIAKLISMVPQDYRSDLDFSVIEIVLMGRYPYLGLMKSEKKEDYEIADEAMKKSMIYKLRDRVFKNMSSGEKQLCLIARSLAQEARLMLLDEPTSNLDLNNSIKIMRLLKTLSEEKITIIAAMHNINLAALYADRIILMRNGEIFEEGTPQEVIREDSVKKVYGTEVIINEHPILKRPQIMLIP